MPRSTKSHSDGLPIPATTSARLAAAGSNAAGTTTLLGDAVTERGAAESNGGVPEAIDEAIDAAKSAEGTASTKNGAENDRPVRRTSGPSAAND